MQRGNGLWINPRNKRSVLETTRGEERVRICFVRSVRERERERERKINPRGPRFVVSSSEGATRLVEVLIIQHMKLWNAMHAFQIFIFFRLEGSERICYLYNITNTVWQSIYYILQKLRNLSDYFYYRWIYCHYLTKEISSLYIFLRQVWNRTTTKLINSPLDNKN